MSARRPLTAACLGILVCAWLIPPVAEAQIGRRILRRAAGAAEDELARKAEEMARGSVRCAVGDYDCVDRAKAKGQTPVITDQQGKLMTDDKGAPITDPVEAARRAGLPAPTPAPPAPPAPAAPAAAAAPAEVLAKPGSGAWANYDYVPGDRVLFYDDYASDRVGNFPRRFELVEGSWEMVEWQGGRYLRATSAGTVGITLPEDLPERFTLEFAVITPYGNSALEVTTAPRLHGSRDYAGSAPTRAHTRAGLAAVKGQGPSTMTPLPRPLHGDALVDVRITADGAYMKMYLNEQRVANAPNAVFPRTTRLYFGASGASPDLPIMIGPVRVAAGGLALYDALEREGRVATHGVLFAVDSDVLRPESTPTLHEIGEMLKTHAALGLTIEGHTDSDGDDAHNLDLSRRRAASVKAYLVETFGVDASRLETQGLGESRPVADNATPEGRQQNRRVELVKRGG